MGTTTRRPTLTTRRSARTCRSNVSRLTPMAAAASSTPSARDAACLKAKPPLGAQHPLRDASRRPPHEPPMHSVELVPLAWRHLVGHQPDVQVIEIAVIAR